MFHCHGGAEITLKIFKLNALLAKKRSALGILTRIPVVDIFVALKHEGRVRLVREPNQKIIEHHNVAP